VRPVEGREMPHLSPLVGRQCRCLGTAETPEDIVMTGTFTVDFSSTQKLGRHSVGMNVVVFPVTISIKYFTFFRGTDLVCDP
jgi:hypothetical protein